MKSHEHAVHHGASHVALADDLRELVFVDLASHFNR